MRISTTQLYTEANRNMMEGQSRLAEIQDKIASGKNFTSLADDPVGANQVVNLRREMAQIEMFQSNIDATRRRLDLEETTLANLNIAFDRARELTIQGASNTLTDVDRRAISYELEELMDYAANLMNTRDAKGEYLFSGSKGTTPAYGFENGQYVYQGDAGNREIQIASSVYVDSTDSGRTLFESITGDSGLTASGDLAGSLVIVDITDQDAFDKLMRASGDLNLSVSIINDGTNDVPVYSLLNSTGSPLTALGGESLSNVPYSAASASPNQISVAINGAVLTLELPAQASVTADPSLRVKGGADSLITDVTVTDAVGFATQMLGYGTTAGTGDLIVDVTYSATTGYSWAVSESNNPSSVIDSGTYTNSSNNSVKVALNGATFDLKLPLDGVDFRATLAYVPPTEALLRFSQEKTSILNALQDTVTAMREPAQGDAAALDEFNAQMELFLNQIGQAQTRVGDTISTIGSRQNAVNRAESSNFDFKLMTQTTLSAIEDVDYAKASTDLARQQLALEAAYASFAKIQGLSLFNYLN